MKEHATVLDACCGSRMFWFDRKDPRCVFLDKRQERHALKDKNSPGGYRALVIEPDMQGDFTSLPFNEGRFELVVFDPPHLKLAGKKGWLAKKYGVLGKDWQEELSDGFRECFRVLKPYGTLVFKWNEYQIPLKDVLALTPQKPLFGSRGGKAFKSHWVVFQKPALQSPPIAKEGV